MRRTEATTTTSVRHVARPMGRNDENGPHLSDLRKFVEECEGLPADLKVYVEKGYMHEGGRYDVTLSVTWQHPKEADQ